MDMRYPGMDWIIVRRTPKSEYVGWEHEVMQDDEVAEDRRRRHGPALPRFAFDREKFGRKIHAIHKANIMELLRLFLRCAREVAKGCPVPTVSTWSDDACVRWSWTVRSGTLLVDALGLSFTVVVGRRS